MRALPLALAGLCAGALAIAVLPADALFVRRDPTLAESGRFACAMMDYVGPRPANGACPVCGMALQRIEAGALARVQRDRMGLQLATIATGPAVVRVRGTGTAQYDDRFTTVIIPRVAGRIVKRYEATFGCCQEVAAGEEIIDLYSPEAFAAQVELAAAIARRDQAGIAALRLRFARWNLAHLADAVIAGAAPNDIIAIRAPFAGQVLLDDTAAMNQALMVGREIAADTPLLRLIDGDRLTLVVHVPETRAAFLRLGQSVDLASDDLGPMPQVTATVSRISNEITPATRSVEVRLNLTGTRGVLRAGALVTVQVRAGLGPDLGPALTELPSALGHFVLIPKDAVLSTGVRHLAWKLDRTDAEGRMRFVPVPLWLGPRIEGTGGEDHYIVRAGLTAGDRVAARGAFLLDAQAQIAGTPSLLYPGGQLPDGKR